MSKILFISYDGLTDPLGQSQIIPYLKGLSLQGHQITILSCEKQDKYQQNKALISKLLAEAKIDWQYTFFSHRPPILAKFWDIWQLKRKAVQLQQQENFDIVHCRSYVPAFVGQYLKQHFSIKMLFDMRGFWVDERVDGGLWNLKNPLFRIAYHYYKKREQQLIQTSDALISLTEAGKREIKSWPAYQALAQPPFIQVIPCSADFDLFQMPSKSQKRKARQTLGFKNNQMIISYLGSVGTWYMLDEMLDFFVELRKTYPDAQFLFLTAESSDTILTAAQQRNLPSECFKILFSPRAKVSFYLSASDVNIFFVKPLYSKKASSPVKLGEALALGLPVIANAGVGDVDEIIRQTDGGAVLSHFTTENYAKLIAQLPFLQQKKPAQIRAKAFAYYDLQRAIHLYEKVYEILVFST